MGWCYGLKFLPSIIILLSVYATTLMAFCTEVTLDCKPVSTCNWVYPSQNGTVLNEYWSGWTSASHQHFLYKIQHTIAFAFVFYLGMPVELRLIIHPIAYFSSWFYSFHFPVIYPSTTSFLGSQSYEQSTLDRMLFHCVSWNSIHFYRINNRIS